MKTSSIIGRCWSYWPEDALQGAVIIEPDRRFMLRVGSLGCCRPIFSLGIGMLMRKAGCGVKKIRSSADSLPDKFPRQGVGEGVQNPNRNDTPDHMFRRVDNDGLLVW